MAFTISDATEFKFGTQAPDTSTETKPETTNEQPVKKGFVIQDANPETDLVAPAPDVTSNPVSDVAEDPYASANAQVLPDGRTVRVYDDSKPTIAEQVEPASIDYVKDASVFGRKDISDEEFAQLENDLAVGNQELQVNNAAHIQATPYRELYQRALQPDATGQFLSNALRGNSGNAVIDQLIKDKAGEYLGGADAAEWENGIVVPTEFKEESLNLPKGQAILREAVQGFTLSWADELYAAYTTGNDEEYERVKARYNKELKMFEATNPVAATVAYIGGGVGNSIMLGALGTAAVGGKVAAVGARGLLTKEGLTDIAGAVGASAVEGGIESAGQAETGQKFDNILNDSLSSGLIGGGIVGSLKGLGGIFDGFNRGFTAGTGRGFIPQSAAAKQRQASVEINNILTRNGVDTTKLGLEMSRNADIQVTEALLRQVDQPTFEAIAKQLEDIGAQPGNKDLYTGFLVATQRELAAGIQRDVNEGMSLLQFGDPSEVAEYVTREYDRLTPLTTDTALRIRSELSAAMSYLPVNTRAAFLDQLDLTEGQLLKPEAVTELLLNLNKQRKAAGVYLEYVAQSTSAKAANTPQVLSQFQSRQADGVTTLGLPDEVDLSILDDIISNQNKLKSNFVRFQTPVRKGQVGDLTVTVNLGPEYRDALRASGSNLIPKFKKGELQKEFTITQSDYILLNDEAKRLIEEARNAQAPLPYGAKALERFDNIELNANDYREASATLNVGFKTGVFSANQAATTKQSRAFDNAIAADNPSYAAARKLYNQKVSSQELMESIPDFVRGIESGNPALFTSEILRRVLQADPDELKLVLNSMIGQMKATSDWTTMPDHAMASMSRLVAYVSGTGNSNGTEAFIKANVERLQAIRAANIGADEKAKEIAKLLGTDGPEPALKELRRTVSEIAQGRTTGGNITPAIDGLKRQYESVQDQINLLERHFENVDVTPEMASALKTLQDSATELVGKSDEIIGSELFRLMALSFNGASGQTTSKALNQIRKLAGDSNIRDLYENRALVGAKGQSLSGAEIFPIIDAIEKSAQAMDLLRKMQNNIPERNTMSIVNLALDAGAVGIRNLGGTDSTAARVAAYSIGTLFKTLVNTARTPANFLTRGEQRMMFNLLRGDDPEAVGKYLLPLLLKKPRNIPATEYLLQQIAKPSFVGRVLASRRIGATNAQAVNANEPDTSEGQVPEKVQ